MIIIDTKELFRIFYTAAACLFGIVLLHVLAFTRCSMHCLYHTDLQVLHNIFYVISSSVKTSCNNLLESKISGFLQYYHTSLK